MKLGNDTTTGVWRAVKGITYTQGDIIFGSFNESNIIAKVSKDFTYTGNRSDLNNLEYYDPTNTLVTKEDIESTLRQFQNLYNSEGQQVTAIDAKGDLGYGIYALNINTKNLPKEYTPSDDAILRISKNSGILREIIDFTQGYYFICQNTSDWIELTNSKTSDYLKDSNKYYEQAVNSLNTVNSIIKDCYDRIQYKEFTSYIKTDQSITGLFENKNTIGYLLNLSIQETISGVKYNRKYSIEVDNLDEDKTIYDEYSTIKSSNSIILGKESDDNLVNLTSIYEIYTNQN